MSIKSIFEQIVNTGKAHESKIAECMQDYRKARQQAAIRAEKLYPEVEDSHTTDGIRHYTESFSEKRERERDIAEKNRFVHLQRERYIKDQTKEPAEKAKAGIAEAEKKFQSDIAGCVKNVRSELRDSVTATLNPNFLNTLKMFYDYNIPLSRTETEALIRLAYHNTTALSAINKTLEKTGSKYVLRFKSVSDYENELDALERIAASVDFYPSEYNGESVELLKSTDPNASMHIHLTRSAFLSAMNNAEMAAKAFDDESNDLIALRPEKPQNNNSTDNKEVSPTEIKDNEANTGIKLAKDQAASDAAAREGLAHYLK